MKPKLIIGNKNYSSWSLRPWLLMKEAGIDFDEHRIVLDTSTTQHEIAEFTDAGRVPVLQLGDLTVWDSLAICETVAERWPDKKLWPGNEDERAHARSIAAEMHAGFPWLRECMPMNCRAMGRKVSIPDELGDDIDRIISIWAECHKHHGDRGGWLFGTFSVADAMYAPVVSRFRTYGVALPAKLQDYADAVWGLSAMQEWRAGALTELE